MKYIYKLDLCKALFRRAARWPLGTLLSRVLFLAILLWAASGLAASDSPVRIGALYPLTGPLAILGKQSLTGVQIALEETGYKIGQRPIELIVEDSQGDAAVGLTKARRLMEQVRIHALIGVISTPVAVAIRDLVASSGIPWIIAAAAHASLTQERRAPNIFRVSNTDDQQHLPMGEYFYKKLGFKSLILVALDYAAGLNHAAAFERVYSQAGGKVISKVFFPLGTGDLAPYIATILKVADKADAVHAIVWGSDAISFIKQANEFGLRQRIPLTGFGTLVEDMILPAEGKAASGVVNYMDWAASLDLPLNRELIKKGVAKLGQPPSEHLAYGYDAGRAYLNALTAVDGKAEDVSRLLAALRGTKIPSPRGVLEFDEFGQVILKIRVRNVAEREGKLTNVVVDEIPDRVTQFGIKK